MASNLMARRPVTRLSEVVMTPSTPSSARLEQASTCPFVDLEPTVIDEVRTSAYHQLFHPK
jgi:hypothetical protein